MKLNLGCGQDYKDGYVNVDKEKTAKADLFFDIEKFPWPIKDNEVTEIYMSHVLEHVGQTSHTYLQFFQEMYRVRKRNAKIQIIVPHPRHDHFLDDPTHVRAVTESGLRLFSKEFNEWCADRKAANTPLAINLGVDFKFVNALTVLDPYWAEQFNKGVPQKEIEYAIKHFNNVVQKMSYELQVVKPKHK